MALGSTETTMEASKAWSQTLTPSWDQNMTPESLCEEMRV